MTDAYWSGRKRKLSETQQEEYEATVHDPPEEVGIDAAAWTPTLVQQYLDETYEIEYSLPSCRRLLKEAGLSYQKPAAQPLKPTQTSTKSSTRSSKNGAGDGRHSSLHRSNKEIRAGRTACRVVSPRHAAGRRTLWPARLDVLARRDHRKRRFFSRFEEYVTAEHAKQFILSLCKEFEDDLIVVLDGAPYFQVSTVTNLAARVDLASVTLPTYSPELNPVEKCWRPLQASLSSCFFDLLDELTTAIDTALDQLGIPEVSNYF